MKKLTFLGLMLAFSLNTVAQIRYNLELGGSNFTGLGVNMEYLFKLGKEKKVYFAPSIGIGHTFYWDNKMTVQAGLTFGYIFRNGSSIALTSDVSYLFQSPFPSFSDYYSWENNGALLWYTGLDYQWQVKKMRYSIGAGMIMHFSPQIKPGNYYFSGDAIPMIKLGIGL